MSTPATQEFLKEAFELHNLQTNTSLLDYGLKMGFIERGTNGQMFMEMLNIKLMNDSQVVWGLLLEVLVRIGVFVSATGLVKLAIYSEDYDSDAEDGIKCSYALTILFHQFINYDQTSIRTINRLFMTIAIIIFSLDTPDTRPCEDMKKFKHKIRYRLAIDYYLWCMLFAMDLVLTCSSPYYVNLEKQFGVELNISHVMLSTFCVIHLSQSMQMIGFGRLNPLIIGTPLLFLDAGVDITPAKSVLLFFYYLRFWFSDWHELVDWRHSMLCDAGVCKILSTEKGNLRNIMKKAMYKFDEWRIEEGLDDGGLYILLDPPPFHTNAIIPQTGLSNDDNEQRGEPESSRAEQYVDHTEQVIYLESRNPLLTTLAAIILIFWK